MTRFSAILALLVATTSLNADDRPNILLIMADDIGIEGLECYGGTSYKTPSLNRLSKEGVRFTRAYSQPLCTPTRVQMMTGKYNHRNWKYFGILDPEEKTFGHVMRDAGYATGIFGKWQLQSYDPPDLPGSAKRRGTGMHPKDAGFDEYALFHSLHTEDKGSRYANPTMLEGIHGKPGTLKRYDGAYGEDIWVDKIVDFFDRHREKPTFVYYPMALPHWPFEPTPHSNDWDPANTPEPDLKYSPDMIEYMDTTVGNLLEQMEERGLRDNTMVLFYSDNGTHLSVNSEMSDGRVIQGGKATTKQTGIHVPLIAHWPGKIKPAVCDEIIDASDFMPTLAEIARATPPFPCDGVSFAPVLRGEDYQPRDWAFFWYDPRPGWDKERFRRHVFVVNKDYKLFRDGRFFRLTDTPLEEIEIDPLSMTSHESSAHHKLMRVINDQLSDEEPPLVDAYGREEHDFLYVPKDRAESDKIAKELLAGGKEFVYGDETIKEQRLWIFTPLDIQPEEKRPCVFLVHGGGWGGNPSMLAAQAVYLQRRGYVTVAVHFRRPSGSASVDAVTPQDTLRDARLAYRWIQKHGEEHQIDIERIVVSGGSAGGHLSLALATIPLRNDPVVSPAGFVLFNPVIDLVDGWQAGQRKCREHQIDPASFSPAHFVTESLAPILVLSGSEDALITPPMIDAFGKRVSNAKGEFRSVIYPGAEHGFFNYGRNENKYFRWTMWQFEQFLEDLWSNR